MTAPIVEHFFRHEYGRLVAMLVRRVGAQRIEAIEDSVQHALIAALEHWPIHGPPACASAWLYRVAVNHLVDEFRKSANRQRILERNSRTALNGSIAEVAPTFSGEVQADLLRMLFVCCDPHIPPDWDRLDSVDVKSRLPAVLTILYVLFTEGHLSVRVEAAMRRELCQEAIRLALILAGHSVGQCPETYALLALMHLHDARADARQDHSGVLLLLEDQDRTRWNRRGIETGLGWLARSATGTRLTRYHAEAGIAAEHCLAVSFESTRWDRIVEYYELLDKLAPSALYRLNRAIALAELEGPQAALTSLEGIEPPRWLSTSYLWPAVLADLHARAEQPELAAPYRETAIDSAPTPAIRAALRRRLAG